MQHGAAERSNGVFRWDFHHMKFAGGNVGHEVATIVGKRPGNRFTPPLGLLYIVAKDQPARIRGGGGTGGMHG